MKRLKKIANLELTLQLSQYILDILNGDILPIITDMKQYGIGKGIDETNNVLNNLKDEYNFISKKSQEMSKVTNISFNCNNAKEECEKAQIKLEIWNEKYLNMPTETEDQKYEKEEYEYYADKIVLDTMEKLLEINYEIETETNSILNQLTKRSKVAYLVNNYNNSHWYNDDENDEIVLTINVDGSVYGCGNEFDFDAKDINEALMKLQKWDYYRM